MLRRKITGIISDHLNFRDGLHFVRIHLGKFQGVEKIGFEEASVLLREDQGILDLRGMLVLPGFIDSHVHLIGSAMYLTVADLSGAESLEEISEKLKSAPSPSSEFLLGGRLNSSRLNEEETGRLPSFLDEAFVKPVFIRSVEHHSGFLNQVAWDLLEVESLAGKLHLPSGEVSFMKSNRRIHGKIYEAVTERLYDFFTESDRKRVLNTFLDELPRLGVTEIHCLEGYGADPEIDFRVILEADAERQDVDLLLYPRTTSVRTVKKYGLKRMGGCILIDGAIGARTASFSSPYNDNPDNTGIQYFADDALAKLVYSSASAGLQLAVHAIGDKAIEQFISICEEVNSGSPNLELSSLRFRLEHFCAGTRGHFERASKIGIVSGMQPSFDYSFGGPDGVYVQALGSERALNLNPLRTALDAGVKVGGGSDSPITPICPLTGIYSACNHHNPRERLTFQEAVQLFTEGSAYLAFRESAVGRIAEGYLADFVALEGDTTSSNVHLKEPFLTAKNGVITFSRIANH